MHVQSDQYIRVDISGDVDLSQIHQDEHTCYQYYFNSEEHNGVKDA